MKNIYKNKNSNSRSFFKLDLGSTIRRGKIVWSLDGSSKEIQKTVGWKIRRNWWSNLWKKTKYKRKTFEIILVRNRGLQYEIKIQFLDERRKIE